MAGRDRELPHCICGDEVAVPHKECMALLTPDERDRWNGGTFVSMPYESERN